jgi:phosphoserine aminotransferase
MTNKHMVYFTPGPSQLFPSVKQHINQALEDGIPSLSHRSAAFHEIVKQTYEGLRALLGIPSDYHIFFVSSGTESMERIIQNCVDERSMHFVNGAFSKRFYDTAKELGKRPEIIFAEPGQSFDFVSLYSKNELSFPWTGESRRLQTHGSPTGSGMTEEAELICFTHNETSTGVTIDLEEVYKIKKQSPMSLIALDIVSSAPYVQVDYTKLDCVFFSVQKGFGLPAGLGIIVVSPRAMQKAQKRRTAGGAVGSYHSFPAMEEQAQKFQTVETPNVLTIFLLSKVLQDMLEKGIDTIRKETEEKAALLYDFFDNHPQMKPFITDKKNRSSTVIVINTPQGSKEVITQLKKNRATVGAGYGDFKQTSIRIANFPAHSLADIEQLLGQFKVILASEAEMK